MSDYEDEKEIKRLSEQDRAWGTILKRWLVETENGYKCYFCESDAQDDGNQTGQPDDKGTYLCEHDDDCIVLEAQRRNSMNKASEELKRLEREAKIEKRFNAWWEKEGQSYPLRTRPILWRAYLAGSQIAKDAICEAQKGKMIRRIYCWSLCRQEWKH